MTEQAFLGCPLLAPNGEAPRKCGVNIGCFTSRCLGNRAQGRQQLRGRTKKKTLKFACWNVRTLMDRTDTGSDRPERRTAIVARELGRYDIDIAALCETRFVDEGQLCEIGGGYTFFWKGLPANERRIHGVGFAIKNNLIDLLVEMPSGINERLMTLRLHLSRDRFATVVCAYAPTMDYTDVAKESFYAALRAEITKCSKNDRLIVLGDFNARVGKDNSLWPNTIGKHGVGRCNSNGMLLLSFCAENNLVITNTLFQLRNRFKTSWCHPRSKHWHLLDYVIVRREYQRDVCITRAMTGADDCWTDHRLIRSVMSLTLAPKRRQTKKLLRPKFDVSKLKDSSYATEFQRSVEEKLSRTSPSDQNVHDGWELLKSLLNDSCLEVLGKTTRVRDWFDENEKDITHLIEAKRKALTAWRNHPTSADKKAEYRRAKAVVQKRTRQMKDAWWRRKAAEMQLLADKNNTRAFFAATKEIYGPTNYGIAPLKTVDGVLLKDKNAITCRWKEYFHDLLNREATVDEEAIAELQQRPTNEQLNVPPSVEEINTAIQQLKSNKAAGEDGLPAEIYKCGGGVLRETLHQLFSMIWEQETLPADLKNALIVTVFKKGDKSDCGNYRGISLLSAAGKILTRELLNRLLPIAEDLLPESQCGFRAARGTVDMIFTARQLQEKCQEQNCALYMAFFDLSKAFDSIHRPLLWEILKKYGCPTKFINVVRLFHDDMEAAVINGNSTSDKFPVRVGVKQGCVIAPTLFSIFLAAMLEYIDKRLQPSVSVAYRTDGKLFNLRRLQAKSKVTITTVVELQYADDSAVCAHSAVELQSIIDIFAEAYAKFGLSVNHSKTKVLFQPIPHTCPPTPVIKVDDISLEVVEQFQYLGSLLSQNMKIDLEVEHRIQAASVAFGKLWRRVFGDHDIRLRTKISVYKAVIIPTLLYGAEAWTVYRRHMQLLDMFHQRCLRRILRFHWSDRRSNVSVLQQTHMASVETMLKKLQLRWSGHVVRMDDSRLPKQLFYGQLEHYKRNPGGQKLRYKDTLKNNLKACRISTESWEDLARQRCAWRRTLLEKCEAFEEARQQHEAERRAGRKTRQAERMRGSAPPLPTGLQCPTCGFIARARIGLLGHMRKHGPTD